MSIYIPGMDMPKSCAECRFFVDAWCYAFEAEDWRNGYNSALDGERLENCPLVEAPPHGRCIDADALWEKAKSERALKEHCPKSKSIIYDTGFLAGYCAACQIASKMPTIIPADPAEEDAL